MPVVHRMYPYAFSSDLRLRGRDPYDPSQENVSLEFAEGSEDEHGNQRFDLKGDDRWKELRITVDAYLPERELKRILPHPNSAPEDTDLIVSLRCPASKLRWRTVLDNQDVGSWSGDVLIRRCDVRSVVELVPLLVRSTRIPAEAAPKGYATARGLTVASGPSLSVVVDPAPSPAGVIKVTWEDFRGSQDPWRKSRSNDLYYLDLSDDERPVLFLNARHTSFKSVLHSSDSRGMNAALRNSLNGWLSNVVWSQLFLASLGSIETDGEMEIVEMPSGWRGGVLNGFLPKMFPESASDEDRLRRAAEMRAAPEQVGQLVSRLGAAVADATKSTSLMTEALRAAERGETT